MVSNGKLIPHLIPKSIRGNFICTGMGLKSLEGLPFRVSGDIDISNNYLSTLEGFPVSILKKIHVDNNIGNLDLEAAFLEHRELKNDYWKDLLMFMTKHDIMLDDPKITDVLSNYTIKKLKDVK
jgi:hypothetical protein